MNQLVTEARALCRDVTTGPWNDFEGSIGDGCYPVAQCTEGHPDEDANGRFIARSRTLLPEMAAEIERLQAELDAAKRDIQHVLEHEEWDVCDVCARYVGNGKCDECRNQEWRGLCSENSAEALAAMKEDAHG